MSRKEPKLHLLKSVTIALPALLVLISCGGASSSSLTRESHSIPIFPSSSSSEESSEPSKSSSSTSSSASSASKQSEEITSSEEISSEASISSEVSSSSSEAPQPKQDLVSDLTEANYSEFPIRYIQKVASIPSLKAITKGQTVATVWFIETTQSIDVTYIKGEYSYLLNESHSSLVNTVHTAYYHDTRALYKDQDQNDFTLSSLDDYLNIYGTCPFDYAIEGYKVTDDALLSITKNEVEENYSFTMKLDPEKSSTNVRIQMKKFGALDDYPKFSEITLTVVVKEDYTPVSIHLESVYDAKKVVDTQCKQSYDVTFSNFGENIEIPDLEMAVSRFN